MATDIVHQQLAKTLTGGSLAKLVKAKQRERTTMLLIDCSGSMGEPAQGSPAMSEQPHQSFQLHQSKMSALRAIVTDLNAQGLSPLMMGFGLNGGSNVGFIERIPEPSGSTPLAEAIQFASHAGGRHLIVISDGLPDSPQEALQAARMTQVTIDVFYVGPRPHQGEAFLQHLAKASGGQCQSVSLSQPKELMAGLKGLLGA